jgi:CBS domain-containing protein
MRVEQVMSKAKCCRETDSVIECAKMMRDESIGFVPICDEKFEPIGAVTDRDLAIRVLADGRSPDEPISTFMTRDVVSCRIDDDVSDVEKLMREHRKSRVMVCDDDGKLRGVVSLHDLAEMETEESIGETVQQVKSDQPTAH